MLYNRLFPRTRLPHEESCTDKPFLTRQPSAPSWALGDWGLVFGAAWGVGRVVIVTGFVIYAGMGKPDRKGLGRLF